MCRIRYGSLTVQSYLRCKPRFVSRHPGFLFAREGPCLQSLQLSVFNWVMRPYVLPVRTALLAKNATVPLTVFTQGVRSLQRLRLQSAAQQRCSARFAAAYVGVLI